MPDPLSAADRSDATALCLVIEQLEAQLASQRAEYDKLVAGCRKLVHEWGVSQGFYSTSALPEIAEVYEENAEELAALLPPEVPHA